MLKILSLLLLWIPEAATATETVLYFNSSPGDYIGAGQQQYYTDQQVKFTVSRNFDNGVSFAVTGISNSSIWWYLDLAAPNKATLIPGEYDNAVRYPFQPLAQPGLSFDGEGRGCNTLKGSFAVLEATYDSKGAVLTFAADFVQYCEGGTAALYGSIRYNSTINNPVPVLNSLSPATVPGGAAFSLTVNGINFLPSSVVQWNGTSRGTTFASNIELTAAIPSADLVSAGSAQITVFNPGQGGGISNSLTVTIVNPVPVLKSVAPSSTVVGSADFTLAISGTNFLSTSVVQWNGNSRVTTFVSSMQLTAAIPSSDIASTGTAQVTVFNPAPGGGISNALSLTVGNPAPMLSGLSPSSGVAGGAGFTLTVNGTGFVQGAIVQWNSSGRNTTFISNTQLQASILPSDIASPGTGQVRVFNPAPGGGTSIGLNFNIQRASPTISSLGIVNAASFAGGPTAPGSIISLFGTNLALGTQAFRNVPLTSVLLGTQVLINGIPAPLFYVSFNQINAQVPFEVPPDSSATVVILNNGLTSAPAVLPIVAAQPGVFFYTDGTVKRGAVLDASFALVTPTNPAAPGGVIVIFATGLGRVKPPVATGDATQGLSTVSASISVMIGGQPASVEFAGLAPGFVGLYQVNAVVPTGLAGGDLPVVLASGGITSTPVMVAVGPSSP